MHHMEQHQFSKTHVIVVGAGPAGLTAATELSQMGFRVTLLEMDEKYVGGISRTVEYKGFRFDLGGHRFFSKNADITQWWQKRLPGEFCKVKRKSRILYGGNYYHYPLRPFNALRGLGITTSIKCVISYFISRVLPAHPETTFEDWVSNRFGKTLYNIFFKTYTEKVWGMECSSISADWASQRIKGLSLGKAILHSFLRKSPVKSDIKTLIDCFDYPRLGPGMMWEKTRDDLVAAGVSIFMGKRVCEISRSGETIESIHTTTSAGVMERWVADDYIFSMPLRDFVLCVNPALEQDVYMAAQKLSYRDFIVVALIIEKVHLFEDNWIYVHDPHVKVGRIQNFNNWSAALIPNTYQTCLGFEYFCTLGDNIWSLRDNDLVELAKLELEKLNLATADLVRDACVVRVEKAYPVYDVDYHSRITAIRVGLASLKNAQVVGRNGMHKYNNQDHSMMTGILAARKLSGGSLDPWRVNTDAEYLENSTESTGGRLAPKPLRSSPES